MSLSELLREFISNYNPDRFDASSHHSSATEKRAAFGTAAAYFGAVIKDVGQCHDDGKLRLPRVDNHAGRRYRNQRTDHHIFNLHILVQPFHNESFIPRAFNRAKIAIQQQELFLPL